METVALIPAYNEGRRIGDVVEEVKKYVNRVVVVDDGSEDETREEAREAGAKVLTHEENRGYLEALKTGFRKVDADVIVTLDADGEMNPGFIPDLVEPIEEGEADLVMGRREKVPRISERFLSFLASFETNVSDTGTGYRAIRGELAREMELRGVCPCGTFVLEAERLGAEVVEVPVENRDVDKPKRIAWDHFVQFWHVLWMLLSP